MINFSHRLQLLTGLVFAAVTAATRFNHFGSGVSLPDASLAMLFLAGLYLCRRIWLAVLIATAGLTDRASIAGGVSDWCVTAAYGFLIPAYVCIWFAGRWYGHRARMAWSTLGPLAGALGAGVAAAFVISNGAFYLFSGYFDDMGWSAYMRDVIGYFPAYAGYTLMYVAAAACVHALIASLPRHYHPRPEAK